MWSRTSGHSSSDRISRTPHEMSNPTPPGDTTPPSSGSVAATPPMGNPYPQWMSGMAYEASTMPGSVATLATCSTARSSTALVAISSVANTMPGTRIPGTVPIGTRHTKGSTRSRLTSAPKVPRQTSR